MTIDELRAFVSIARLGGFARAAGALHRSQPAISRRIEMLEQTLGSPLFERVPGGVVMTETGRAFLPYAEAVLAGVQDGLAAVRALASGERGTVALAVVGTLASTHLTAALRRFAKRHPEVKLDLRTANSQEVSELVRRGEATLGLRYFTDSDPTLVSEPVMAEALVVACAPDHALAGTRVRDLKRLAGERWVSFPARRRRAEGFVSVQEDRLVAAGLGDAEIVHIDSLTAQKRFVEAGFGMALLIESSIQEELAIGSLALIDVPALRGSVPVTLVHRRAGHLGAAARTLVAALKTGLAGPAKRRRSSPRKE
jgi:DNA-binding transcriptional LysR family regulator